MTVLQTLRLTLKPCAPADRDDFITLELDPDVMRFLNGGAVDHALTDPESAPFLMPRGTEPYVWTARRNADESFVGWFCLWPESEKLAELGYRLRRADWGKGLAFEGAAALVEWGFTGAGYDTIAASTMAVNLGSRRVMEKLGMKHTRSETYDFPDPIPGSEHGEVVYELARTDWRGSEQHQ